MNLNTLLWSGGQELPQASYFVTRRANSEQKIKTLQMSSIQQYDENFYV